MVSAKKLVKKMTRHPWKVVYKRRTGKGQLSGKHSIFHVNAGHDARSLLGYLGINSVVY